MLSKYLYLRNEIRDYNEQHGYQKSNEICNQYLEMLEGEIEECTEDKWFCYFMLAKNSMYLQEQTAIGYIYEAIRLSQLTRQLSNYQNTIILKIRVFEELNCGIALSLYQENKYYLLQLLTPYCKTSIEYDKYDILQWLSLVCNNIGEIYGQDIATYDKAEEELLNAIEMREEIINNANLSEYTLNNLIKKLDNTYGNLCNLYLKFNKIPFIKIYTLINKIQNEDKRQQLLDEVIAASAVNDKKTTERRKKL